MKKSPKVIIVGGTVFDLEEVELCNLALRTFHCPNSSIGLLSYPKTKRCTFTAALVSVLTMPFAYCCSMALTPATSAAAGSRRRWSLHPSLSLEVAHC